MITTAHRRSEWTWPLNRGPAEQGASPAGMAHTSAAAVEGRASATRTERDQCLATVCANAELAWLLAEQFDAERDTWTVDIVRIDAIHGWRKQRYKYDTEKGILYFWGERPLTGGEVRSFNLRAMPVIHSRRHQAMTTSKPAAPVANTPLAAPRVADIRERTPVEAA